MGSESISGRMAEWVAGVKFGDLPRRVVEEAKNQILSMIASVHAGHFSDIGRATSRTVKEWAGGKDSTLIPSGEKASVHYAIFGNAALSMALEYDDYLFAAHTGHSSVLATLALAERENSSGQDVLLAQVLANEIGGRVGASTLLAPLSAEMRSFVHLAGGAVACAKLKGLDAEQTQHAIGIALLQPSFGLVSPFFGSDAKALVAAMTAPTGVQAGEMAANGIRGAADVFESDGGFLNTFTPQPLLGAFDAYGQVWLTDTLSYKTYPGSAYIGASIDCVLNLVRQHHIDARKVRNVDVRVGPLTLAMDAQSARFVKGPESNATTLNFSVAYNVAAALCDKELSPRQFTRDRIKDAAVWDLASKVRLSRDEQIAARMEERTPIKRVTQQDGETRPVLELATADLISLKTLYGAHVRIEMEDGRNYETEQELPQGSGGRAFDDRRKVVEDKFRRETRYTLRKERMEKAIDLIHHLEGASASQVREMIRLCCSERA
jgi:2-methylcitrate dehydratase PrpD